MYKEYKQLNLPAFEQEILAQWQQHNTFEASISIREGATPFVFYEGPPSANGLPGIHHVISRTLKDMVCRYKTMKGYQVHRKGGWDTHGLPIELGVEKELGITKEDIGKKITVLEYNQKCREAVLRYKDKWDEITQKMGYWVDLKHPYVTYDNNYIESVWWLLSKMYNRGYLYESVSIQPYSPAAGTGLSSHELNQPGTYKDVKDTSATVLFKLVTQPTTSTGQEVSIHPTVTQILNLISANKSTTLLEQAHTTNTVSDVYIMAWTTTPWTLPSNLGLTVGAKIEYTIIKTYNQYTHQPICVILAHNLIANNFTANKYIETTNEIDLDNYKGNEKELIPYMSVGGLPFHFTGQALEGLQYHQLLPTEANTLEKIQEITPQATPFKIVLGDFVTTDSGTGIVHTAPAFGADDYKVGKANNLGILTLVDRQGKFVTGMGEYSNRYVKNYKDDPNYVDVNVDIAVALKQAGKAFRVEKYEHSYPHCWRTDKPILYYPLDAWFIRTTAVKDHMIAANHTINWKPESTGTGRFGNWLDNVQDWNLSRSRFWGTPLPIWKTQDGEEQICIGSIAQLEAELIKAYDAGISKVQPNATFMQTLDLHKPFVDDMVLVSAKGMPMYRVPDLIDVWFDSGAMPYAQHHFPFENKERFAQSYPADFIAEGVDQTRGWFYTLHAIAALVKDDIEAELTQAGLYPTPKGTLEGLAYRTVVSNGLVLDKNGVKMSKRLGNIIDPFVTISTYSADATRWYLVTNASPWDNLKFDIDGIKEVQRKFFGTLYNTYQFFALYANVDNYEYTLANDIPIHLRPELDQWILSSLHTLILTVTQAFDNYEPTVAGRAIEYFIDEQLSNWYVRLSRRRFWKSEMGTEKLSAYQTLYTCLTTIAKLIAPIAPFYSDSMYQNLQATTTHSAQDSVHLQLYPVANVSYINAPLEERMLLAQDACSLILSLRKKAIATNGTVGIKVRQPLQKVMIPVHNTTMQSQLQLVEELIKAEVNVKEIEYIQPNNDILQKKIKPNFAALGKKMGANMKAVAEKINAFTQNQITTLEQQGQIELQVNDTLITLELTQVDITTEDVPGLMVATKGLLTTALDITITPTLLQEGNARELVNKIQKLRKDTELNLTDRITVQITDIPALTASLMAYNNYICGEILADNINFVEQLDSGIQVEVNDYQIFVKLKVKSD